MDSNIKTENKTDKTQDPKYAEALVALANMEYKMQQSKMPKQKQLVSKKKLIYIAASIVVTIISLLMTPALFKGKSDTNTEKQLLETSSELKDLQN